MQKSYMLVKPVTTILVHKTKQLRYVCVLVAQLNPALYDPMYHSPPGFSDHGTLEARILQCGRHSLPNGIFLIQGLNPLRPQVCYLKDLSQLGEKTWVFHDELAYLYLKMKRGQTIYTGRRELKGRLEQSTFGFLQSLLRS